MRCGRLFSLTLLLTLAAAAGCTGRPAPLPQPPPQSRPVGVALAELNPADLPRLVMKAVAAPVGNGPPPDLADVDFATEERGFGGTRQGEILTTTDGGVTWAPVSSIKGSRFIRTVTVSAQVAFLTAATGCEPGPNCDGPDVLVTTADGGRNWETIQPQLPDAALAREFSRLRFQFLSGQVGFATLDPTENYGPLRNPGPLFTHDGGRTWQQIPLPQGMFFTGGIQFVTADQGYVTATDTTERFSSSVLATRDGGRTWRTLYTDPSVSLDAVFYASAQDGYAAGGNNPKAETAPRQYVVATHDGGATWAPVSRVDRQSWPIASLRFTTPTEGWAAQGGCYSMGANGPCGGPLLHTGDGGRTWAQTGVTVTRIRTAGRRTWAIGGEGGATTLLRSGDGGVTWQQLYRPDGLRVRDLQFTSPRVGFLQSNLGSYRTADGGASWALYSESSSLEGSLFLTEPRILRSDGGQLLRSDDGGQTWKAVSESLPEKVDPFAAHLAAAGGTAVWASHANWSCPAKTPCPDVLMHSGDGGQTWSVLEPGPGTNLLGLAFADATHGVALGYGNQLLTTADGGKTWTGQTAPKGLIFDTAAYAGQELWIGGVDIAADGRQSGVVLHSPDGGGHFEAWLEPGLMIEEIRFTSPTNGWLLGGTDEEGGLLYATQDGGRSWTQIWPGQ